MLPHRVVARWWVVLPLLATALAALASVAVASPVPRQTATEEVIVSVDDPASAALVAREVGDDRGEVHAVFEDVGPGFAARLSAAEIERLEDDPRVTGIEPDHPIRMFSAPTGVRRVGADEYGPADIDGDGSTVAVDVAILDTGVDGGHPDLSVAGGVDCRTGSCQSLTTPVDPHGHGTHVAGIAAARDDGAGVVGVAPGARIHSVRVLDGEGNGSLSSLLAGLEWVRDHAGIVEVANLSLGCECRSTALDDAVVAVADAGVTLVVAAGNASTDAGGFSPANHPYTVTVAAMSDYDGEPGARAASGCISDTDDAFASYSNHGAVVDLVAPGSCITSTWPDGRYARTSGTSMAAPHVAGAAALYIASEGLHRSSSRWESVRDALAEDLSVASTDACGYAGSASAAPMLHLTCADATGNTAPILDVTAPEDGASVIQGRTLSLRASADDVEDGGLDGSIVWSSSHDGRLGVGGSLDVTLSTLGEHSIVASVTDSSGVLARESRLVTVTDENGSTGGDTGEEPSLPEEPESEAPPPTEVTPQLTIVAPVPDGRLVADRDLLLVARALDSEDGDIRAWVRWRSDHDGELGQGGSVETRLSAGEHRLTAAVTDAQGRSAERTVAVVVAVADELTSRGIDHACPPDQVPDGGFADVEGNAHAAAIDCLAWWGATRGTGDGAYRPAEAITRAQMATFLAETIRRSGGSLPASDGDAFDDVADSVHRGNIERLAAAGIVRGTGGESFDPDGRVTRAQMATFLVQTYEWRAALPLPGIQARFGDVAGGVHESTINAVAAAGVTGGVLPDRYDPASEVRRDQMASFLARTLDLLVQRGVTAPPG